MNLEKFKELQKVIEDNISWDEHNIEEMERKLGKMYQNLTNIYFKEKLLTDDLSVELKKLYSEIFIDLKENAKRSYDSKYEIENVINSNNDYYKMSLEFNQQKAILDWIESTRDNLNNIKFEIKDFMNWKLFKNGMKF